MKNMNDLEVYSSILYHLFTKDITQMEAYAVLRLFQGTLDKGTDKCQKKRTT